MAGCLISRSLFAAGVRLHDLLPRPVQSPQPVRALCGARGWAGEGSQGVRIRREE
jgi:hypothetical protein